MLECLKLMISYTGGVDVNGLIWEAGIETIFDPAFRCKCELG